MAVSFVPCSIHYGRLRHPHSNPWILNSVQYRKASSRRLRTFMKNHSKFDMDLKPSDNVEPVSIPLASEPTTRSKDMRSNELFISPYARPETSPSAPPPNIPPPGREDEFADSNGESLQREQDKGKVATLERDLSFDTVLQELTAIQQDGPRNVAILGTRHTSYLHQQIIELLTYANVLVGNHVFTSGAGGTNAAVIRGALRAERPDLLTVVLPQSLRKQPLETQEQLRKVQNLIEMKKNDPLPLDIASQLCNSDILSRCTHFIAFAFHDSDVV